MAINYHSKLAPPRVLWLKCQFWEIGQIKIEDDPLRTLK